MVLPFGELTLGSMHLMCVLLGRLNDCDPEYGCSPAVKDTLPIFSPGVRTKHDKKFGGCEEACGRTEKYHKPACKWEKRFRYSDAVFVKASQEGQLVRFEIQFESQDAQHACRLTAVSIAAALSAALPYPKSISYYLPIGNMDAAFLAFYAHRSMRKGDEAASSKNDLHVWGSFGDVPEADRSSSIKQYRLHIGVTIPTADSILGAVPDRFT
ncbi:hypothetical protein B0H14DRAFT_2614992 [Mycena olivaceomarginata]|nr:hypothetical protein B0H14DRAFT_2614992 [Mycena olivaceomarginata]